MDEQHTKHDVSGTNENDIKVVRSPDMTYSVENVLAQKKGIVLGGCSLVHRNESPWVNRGTTR